MSSSSTWTWGGGGWEGQSLDDAPELSRAHADVMALLPGSSDWPFWVTDALMSGAHTSNCKWNAQCQCQFKCWFHGSRFHEVTKLYWWDSKHSTPQHQYNQTTQLHMWPRSATSENVVPEEETACRQFFDSVLLAGQRRDYVHHGSELHGLGSVRVQLEGNRVVIMALLDEIRAAISQTTDEEVRLQGYHHSLNFGTLCWVWRLNLQHWFIPFASWWFAMGLWAVFPVLE